MDAFIAGFVAEGTPIGYLYSWIVYGLSIQIPSLHSFALEFLKGLGVYEEAYLSMSLLELLGQIPLRCILLVYPFIWNSYRISIDECNGVPVSTLPDIFLHWCIVVSIAVILVVAVIAISTQITVNVLRYLWSKVPEPISVLAYLAHYTIRFYRWSSEKLYVMKNRLQNLCGFVFDAFITTLSLPFVLIGKISKCILTFFVTGLGVVIMVIMGLFVLIAIILLLGITFENVTLEEAGLYSSNFLAAIIGCSAITVIYYFRIIIDKVYAKMIALGLENRSFSSGGEEGSFGKEFGSDEEEDDKFVQRLCDWASRATPAQRATMERFLNLMDDAENAKI